MTGCQLEADCPAAPIARVARGRDGIGAVAYLTVIPASYGHGGIPACAEHVHALLDGMLMAGLGPAQQPERERLDDPPAGTR